jgi:predicted NUDIX family NTP pyrophosphohydrolase
MPKRSAGILLYRRRSGAPEVLLVHPGGPFWANKDLGAWSIPKGEYAQGEDPRDCALREFEEELGAPPPGQALTELGSTKLAGGKLVTAWAAEGDLDPASAVSNTFTLEWPPRSGVMREFPEIDRAQWFSLAEARRKINPAQGEFLERLSGKLEAGQPPRTE